MTAQTKAIIQECKNQQESCLWTSTGFFIWLSHLKWYNRFWNVLPIVFGAFASWSLLQSSSPVLASAFALLAGLLPAIYEKLDIKAHTDEILAQAGQYKNLENRFKHASTIIALEDDPNALKSEFAALMRQMEDLRSRPIILPEKFFLKARKKINGGHYEFDAEKKGKKK